MHMTLPELVRALVYGAADTPMACVRVFFKWIASLDVYNIDPGTKMWDVVHSLVIHYYIVIIVVSIFLHLFLMYVIHAITGSFNIVK